jgi:tRNA(Ile)-lysidine synthase
VPRARAKPLTDREFAARIARLGPFERKPEIAVAVSGGPDSLALAILLDRWAKRRGGRAIALTVDHGLRRESAVEARRVARWMRSRGITHRTLAWRGRKPKRGIQAAARDARYALLEGWCRRHAILHLALAHHRDDQIETFLMRLGRGSGLDGLAAMSAIAERAGVRLLRPLLDVDKSRLVASLAAMGQDWIEDPSNANPAFERVRLRRLRPGLECAGFAAGAIARTAAALARARAVNAGRIDALLVMAAMTPEGLVRLPGDWLAGVPRPVALRALARLLVAVGGAGYGPRQERLEPCCDWLLGGAGRARTLGGCLLLRHRQALYVLPETPWQAKAAVAGRSGGKWRPLGAPGWRNLAAMRPDLAENPPPPAFRERVLGLWRGGRLLAAPSLGLALPSKPGVSAVPNCVNRPLQPLIPVRFAVA